MRKILTKALTAVISISIIAQLAVIPALAEENSGITTFSDIAETAGNAEMKAYGMAVTADGETEFTDTVPEGSGTTYYVDATGGSDDYDGTSEATAWKTVEKVNEKTYEAGDRILFKAGETWTATGLPSNDPKFYDNDGDGLNETWLAPKGSGEEGNPIILGAYGDEGKPLPKLVGDAKINAVVTFVDQEYWDISNLDISNRDTEFDYTKKNDEDNARYMGNLRGIHVYGQSFSEDGETPGGIIDGYTLHDLYVHDVTGQVYWGGMPKQLYPGTFPNMNQDASKRTGGIIFEVWQPTTEKDLTQEEKESDLYDKPITFNNITIKNNVVYRNSFGGICFKQWDGDGHSAVDQGSFHSDAVEPTYENWGGRKKWETDRHNTPGWHPHTNITITDNYVSQKGSEFACNTIRVASVRGALVEHNVCENSGTCAIELDYTDDTVVQYNEVYETEARMGGADSNAIDADYRTTGALIQYNYVYDNGDGILLCGSNYSEAVWRYNIIANCGDGDNYVALYGDSGFNYLYNNLFFNNKDVMNIRWVAISGDSHTESLSNENPLYIYNNIFYNSSDATQMGRLIEGEGVAYDYNLYYGAGIAVPSTEASGDKHALTDKPYFEGNVDNITINKNTKLDLANFRLQAKSPLIDSGRKVELPAEFTGEYVDKYLGEEDIFGAKVEANKPDIGVSEYGYAEDEGIIRGRVVDEYGNVTSGAEVTAIKTAELHKDYEITVTDSSLGEDKTAALEITNNTEKSETVTPILAVYGNDGNLIYVGVNDEVVLTPEAKQTVTFTDAEIGEDTEYTAKVLLWYSLDGMKPFIDAIPLEVTEQPAYESITAETDENGYYSFGGVDTGTYSLSVKKSGYDDADAVSNTVEASAVTVRDLELGENSTKTGAIQGKVTYAGTNVEGAQVHAIFDSEPVKTVQTGADGTYSLEEVPADKEYTVTVTLDGYKTKTRGNVAVQKAMTKEENFVLQPDSPTVTYGIADDFNGYAKGTFTNDTSDLWGKTGASGTLEIKSITDESGTETSNKYIQINKSGSNSVGLYNKSAANMSGIVTIGARVMRTSLNSNQFGMYSFKNSNWNSSNPIGTSGSNALATFAMTDGKILTHYYASGGTPTTQVGTYGENEWHDIRIVANLNTHTYDFYLDDMEDPVITNYPLRNQTASNNVIDRFLIYSNDTGSGGAMAVDYFYACDGVQLDLNEVPFESDTVKISGKVTSSASPVANAQVKVTNSGNNSGTVRTGSDGSYTVTGLELGETYTVEVSAEDYTAQQKEITITQASTKLDFELSKTSGRTEEPDYAINDDFESYDVAVWNNDSRMGDAKWRPYETHTTRVVEIAAEENGNKYLHISRETGGSTTISGVFNQAETNLTGLVTIEARVKRIQGSSSDQFSMYSFNTSNFPFTNASGIGNYALATFYLTGGKINTHTASATAEAGTYTLGGKWQNIRIVANTGTGLFNFYLNDMTTPALSNQPLRNSGKALSRFLFFSNSQTDGDLCIDDFRVYAGEPYDPPV